MTIEDDKMRKLESGMHGLKFGDFDDDDGSVMSEVSVIEPALLLDNDNPFTTEAQDYSKAPVLIGTTKFEPLGEARNIMITGGGGFIGSWVARHFAKTYLGEYNIFVFDVMDHPCTLENFRPLVGNANFKFIHGDITNSEQVMACMRNNQIDSVMHFAAQSHVDLSFGNSYGFTHTNVIGTHVMLECAKDMGIRRFIHVSTDEVYGEVDENVPDLLETSILSPTNPYAASKAAAEMMVNAYYKSFNLPVIIVRSNNVYGPTQYPEKVIPKFALSMHVGKKLYLHGTGNNTRKYLYGQDAADAFDTIFHKGEIGQIYNVGSEDEVSNIELCHRILAMFGKDTPDDFSVHVEHCQDRPFNDNRYAVDGGKLKALGWEQKVPFEVGLRKTVYWYTRWGLEWWGKDITGNLVPFPQASVKPHMSENDLHDNYGNVHPANRPSKVVPHQKEDFLYINEGKVKQRIIYVGDREGYGNLNGISVMSSTVL